MNDKLKALLSILSLLVIYNIITLLSTFAWVSIAGINNVSSNAFNFLSFCFLMPLLYFYSKSQKINLWKLESTVSFKWILLSVALGVMFASCQLIFMKYTNHLPKQIPTYPTLGFITAEIIGVGILTPIAEELCFRKWMILYMEKHDFSKYTIILVSSILFYLWHQNFVILNAMWRVDTILFGIVQCLLFMKTRNIYYCMILHGVANVSLNALEYQLLF